MSAELFLRIFSDCCIFFALLGCCPTLLPYSHPPVYAALICAASAALGCFLQDKDLKVHGRLCAALPFLSLLLAATPNETLILVVPMVYTAVIILRGSLHQEYFSYTRYFKWSLFLLAAVWTIMSIVVYIEDPKGLQEKVVFTEIILQYALVHLLCGIVLQRQLRLGSRGRGETGQLFGMLGSVGVALFGVVLTAPLFREGGLDLARKAASIFIAPFAALLKVFEYFAKRVETMYESPEYKEALENSEVEYGNVYTDYQDYMQEVLKDQPEQQHSVWIMVVAAAAVLIVLVLMFFAYTRLRGLRDSTLIVGEVSKREEKKQRFSRLTNRGKVRQVYCDFLRRERGRGLKLKKHYTTEDILRRISETTNKNAAAELREIYLPARYDERCEITKEQAAAARAAARRSADSKAENRVIDQKI